MCGLMMAASLGFHRIATADNYQRLVLVVFVVSVIIDTFPLLYFGAQSVNEEREMATPSNFSWSHDPIRPARACYWHAMMTDVRSICWIQARTPQQPCRNHRPCPVVSLSGQHLTVCSRLSCF